MLPSPRQLRKSESEMNFAAFAVSRDLFGNEEMQVDEGLLDGLSKCANWFYWSQATVASQHCAALASRALEES